MKAWSIAVKMLREALRDPQLLVLDLIFPPLMILIYFYAFGGSANAAMAANLVLLVDNQDRGAYGAELVLALRAGQFDGAPVFTVVETHDRAVARTSLVERKAAMLVTIPPDFTQVLQASIIGSPPHLGLLKDPLSDMATFAMGFFDPVVRDFVASKTGWGQPLPTRYEFVTGAGKLNDFQFGVPGVVVFGIMFGIIYTAIVVVREITAGTLRRLRLAGLSGLDMLVGVVFSQLLITVVQVILTFLTAILTGMQNNGSYLLMAGITVLMSLAATGLGLVCACLARNDGEAANLATVFLLPLVFLSGTLFPMPDMPLFTIAGHTLSFQQLMPTAHAADAMRRVMFYGEGAVEVSPQLLWMAVLSLLIFILGAWLFQFLRLDREA